MDAYPSVVGSLGGGGPVGWPRMNFEIHLHLNSELASNEFLTEFALNLLSKSERSGFDLRQSREQAMVDKTNATMSEGGHALPAHPLILKRLHSAPPPPPPLTTHTPPPLPQSSQVVQSASLFAGMKSVNPKSFLLSSVNNILWPYLYFLIIYR